MIRVLLDPEYAQSVSFWVEAQQRHKQRTNAIDLRFDRNQSSHNIALIGKLAEVAAQRVYGGKIDWTIGKRGDSGKDLISDNYTAIVKCNTFQQTPQQSQLIVNRLAELTTDICVLVHFAGDRTQPLHADNVFTVVGHATREYFLQNAKRRNYGYGTRFYLDAEELDSPVSINQQRTF